MLIPPRTALASLILSALLVLSSCSEAPEQRVKPEWYCSYFGQSLNPDEELILFAPDKEAESMVAHVMTYTGLKPSFFNGHPNAY